MPEKTRRSAEPRRFWPACPRLPDAMRKFFVYAGFVVRKGRPKPLLALSDLRNGIRHRAAPATGGDHRSVSRRGVFATSNFGGHRQRGVVRRAGGIVERRFGH